MIVDIKRHLCDGHMLKLLTAAGLAWLAQHQQAVNHMNVFPVPDGDTGTNMRLTMQKAYDAITDLDELHIGLVSDAIAKGALLGARGNSGVILSQLLAGFAQGVRGHNVLDARLFALAARKAVDAAYAAVQSPVEGTILTVAREAYEALADFVETSADLNDALHVMLHAARQSLNRTPELLPVLRKVGKVDSGGMGLVYILEGMARFLDGEQVSIDETTPHMRADTEPIQAALTPEDVEGYGYDVQFLMHGAHLDIARIRDDITAMGWSVLVVGDAELVKVHIHVHDPGVPLSYAVRSGAVIDDIVVENMQKQFEDFVTTARGTVTLQSADSYFPGVVAIAVSTGEGMNEIFLKDLGVAGVVYGGQTMNPSTEDFIAAIEAVPNSHIILLPNNRNVVLAAQQAAGLVKGKHVRIVESHTIPQGIAALLEYINLRDTTELDEIAEAMAAALENIQSGEVTFATSDATFNGVHVAQGQPMALLNGQLVGAGQTLHEAALALFEKARADNYELITLYYGSGVSMEQAADLAQTVRARYDSLEVHVVYGGQPLYPYIISIE